MHRLPSQDTLKKFRFISLIVVLMFLSPLIVLIFMGWGILLEEHQWFLFAGIALLFGLFCLFTNLAIGGRLRCPLCMVPPLLNRRCARHRTARKMFGSYRLRVAQSILLGNHFRCPYCGEPTVMEVRYTNRRG